MDGQGYAWIATQDGAMRYNGQTWIPVDMPDPRKSNWVTAMVLTKGGARWFGTNNGGIARWDGQWTVFDTASGLPSDIVYTLLEAGGTLWAGTAAGPARWTGARWEAFPGGAPWRHGPVRALLVRGGQEDPEVWVGTDAGLGCFRQGEWRWHGLAGGLPSPMVTALLEGGTAEGRQSIWVGTQGGLALGEPGRWQVFKGKEILPHPAISCLKRTFSREGHPVLWVGTEGGLLRWEGSVRRIWGSAQGLQSPVVRSLMVQQEASGRETVWVGTFGGLARYREGTWSTLDAQDGLRDNLVFSLHEDRRQGALWFGTFHGLVSYHQGQWQVHGAAEGLPRATVFSLAEDAGDGALWVGTRGHGLFRLEGGRAQALRGLPDSFVYALHASRDAEGVPVLWVGTRAGLSQWRAGAWTHFGPGQNIPKALVSSITETKAPGGGPQIWVGTRGSGLGVLEAGQQAFTWFDGAKGLVDPRVMHLLATEEDGRPCVWVSTQGGLQQFGASPPRPTDRVLTEASDPPLPGNLVYTARRAPDGSLYAFTNRGVWRQRPKQGGGLEAQTFTTGDGLPSNGCVQGASLVDSHGRVWAGTVLGIAILAPYGKFQDDQAKPLYLEEARNGEGELPSGGPWELSWREPHLKVRFSLLAYHRESDTRFKSQLVGLEGEPTGWIAAAEREFVSLPPGRYVLRFWGRDYLGNVSGPVEISVNVLAPPWLRWWALITYVLLLTGGGVGLILWRVSHLQDQNAELESQVHSATAEVRRQNDTLARINQHLTRLNEEKSNMLGIAAHDLRNPLSAIGLYTEGLLEDGGDPASEAALKKIHKLTKEMALLIERLLNSSRIEAGQLTLHMEGVDVCALLRELVSRHQAAAQAKGLELRVDVPDEGLPDMLADPFHLMEAMDNLVNNALKFMPKGPKGLPMRQVLLRARPGVIEVQDEGPGFSEADRAHVFERFSRLSARPTGGESSTGLGLYIVKALVEAMGGEIELQSEAGHGATFRIYLGKA